MLIVLPIDHPAQKETLLTVAQLLARACQQVKVTPASEVSRRRTLVQGEFEI